MTLDEAIKHAEEVVDGHNRIKQIKAVTLEECKRAEEYRQLAEWLKELKQLREQTSWIPITKRPPDEYGRYLISTDDGMVEIVNYGDTNDLPNEIAFHQWDDEEWQCWKPNVTAWMPRPKAYKAEGENGMCKDCCYNDGEVHAECVICDKAERKKNGQDAAD